MVHGRVAVARVRTVAATWHAGASAVAAAVRTTIKILMCHFPYPNPTQTLP